MTPKKIKFKINSTREYDLIGVSCHLPDYRAVHFFNKTLDIRLVRADDLIWIGSEENTENHHSFYYWHDNLHNATICCVNNRSKNHILFLPLKNFDFLFVVFNDAHRYDIDEMSVQLRKIPQVILANKIDISHMKYSEDFIVQIDLHLDKV